MPFPAHPLLLKGISNILTSLLPNANKKMEALTEMPSWPQEGNNQILLIRSFISVYLFTGTSLSNTGQLLSLSSLLRALAAILCLNPNAVLRKCVRACVQYLCRYEVVARCSQAALRSSGGVGHREGYRWDPWPRVVPAPWFMLPFWWIWYRVFLCLSFSLSRYQPFLN